MRSRVQDIEEGENFSKFFLIKEIKHGYKKEIKFLEHKGNKITQHNAILKVVYDFYQTLYRPEPINENLADAFLEGIEPITENDYMICEGLLTYEECWEAIKLMPNNKSPGYDGLPVEFY